MHVTQTLASGLTIRQDFRTAVRFVFFETDNARWQYATHGGTMFVVLYKHKHYGLTCKHVLKDFQWHQLVVTDERFGTKIAGLQAVMYPSHPTEDAVDSDLLDVAVVQFSDGLDPAYFNETPYVLDKGSMASSAVGDDLQVAGALKHESNICENTIEPKYCRLELVDITDCRSDPTLRHAIGKYKNPEFTNVNGLSGSPVFNVTRNALCGMVVRAGMPERECNLFYIDIFDIDKLLSAIHNGQHKVCYQKQKTIIEKTTG